MGSYSKISTTNEFKKEVYDMWKNEYIVIGAYKDRKTPIKILHNTCKCAFIVTPNSFVNSGTKCPICTNRIIVKGVNDINTTNLKLAKLMLKEQDRFTLAENSGVRVDWICPDCKNIIENRSPNYIRKNGLYCQYCGDGLSYPNKFFTEMFTQLSGQIKNYIREYSPPWAGNRRYDNYFEIDNYKYIVEVDAGLGHGKKVYTNYKYSSEETEYFDKQKENLALHHDISIFRIDVESARHNLIAIRDVVLSSYISSLLDLSNVNWEKCHRVASTSKMLTAVQIYNNGTTSPFKIGKLIGASSSSVTRYLRAGNLYGMCEFTVKISARRAKGKKVICLNNGKIFETLSDAACWLGYNESTCICACCRGKVKSAGKDDNGEPLIWMYYDDFLKRVPSESSFLFNRRKIQ